MKEEQFVKASRLKEEIDLVKTAIKGMILVFEDPDKIVFESNGSVEVTIWNDQVNQEILTFADAALKNKLVELEKEFAEL